MPEYGASILLVGILCCFYVSFIKGIKLCNSYQTATLMSILENNKKLFCLNNYNLQKA